VGRREGHGGLDVAVTVSIVGVGIVGMSGNRFGVRETMEGVDELFRRCHCCNEWTFRKMSYSDPAYVRGSGG
jgi:hypothetical protein